MNERTFRVLEFERIKEMLVRHVSSQLGRDLVENMGVFSDPSHIARLLTETSEARLIYRTEDFPLKGLFDTRPAVRRAALGAIVPPEELFALGQTLSLSRRVARFFAERGESYPLLSQYALSISPLPLVEDEISSCIGEGGDVLDNASEKLRRLRIELRNAQANVKSKLDTMVRSSTIQKYLQENIVTVRNDRYVLPVKAEYKGQVPGLIHDQSASGATLFVEPMAVVELNNKLRQLEAQELQEIERILRELSSLVGENSAGILKNIDVLGILDFAMAKGKMSYALKCTEPELTAGSLYFRRARHPLIAAEEVVPVDVSLGQSFQALLITGPNTGGKTVTLKTIGLLSLMVQSGLHIPVQEGSQAAVFGAIYADIGDEQSIEQSLSTFSSHMVNIKSIVDEADESSLVLLDELGAGTDPTEGAALAMAILDSLSCRRSLIAATTHYSELKAYAHTRDGVQNASMEFDLESLRPTYKLTIGLPGKSNAFEISQRLGLASGVIDRAREYLTKDALKVEDLIRSLEESRRQADEDRSAARALKLSAESSEADAREKLRRLQEKEADILRRANTEAKAIIHRAKHQIDEMIEELKKSQESLSAQEMSRAVEKVRQGWRDLSKELAQGIEEPPDTRLVSKDTVPISVGDDVLVVHLNQRGKVLEKQQDSLVVQLGAMRTTLPSSSVRRIEQPQRRAPASGFGMVALNRPRIGLELDLRGETVDEGVLRIDKYLDDALVAGLSQVHIIHGKGTGALREGVREHLKQHSLVKSYRYGQAGEGGSGVTVVTLKDK
jgi:DNA mismatch repair protein MutS2